MVDRNGEPLSEGSRIKFIVAKNKAAQKHHGARTRKGTVLHDHALGSMIDVVLDGDPFGTYVEYSRVEVIPGERDDNNPLLQSRKQQLRARSTTKRQGLGGPEGGSAVPNTTTNKPNTRELRKQAKALGVEGWEDMSVRALQAAVEAAEDGETTKEEAPKRRTTRATKTAAKSTPAKATAAKKSTAKKAATNGDAESTVAENGNPYKPGTNLWHITEEILKGGKRAAMVKRLKKKVELKPRNAGPEWDEDAELDRRILITGQILRRDHNFSVERGGRGPEDGTIVGTPPT